MIQFDGYWIVIERMVRVSAHLLLTVSLCLLSRFGRAEELVPEEALEWRSPGTGSPAKVGVSGSSIYGASGSPMVLEVWQWDAHRMKKKYACPVTGMHGMLSPGVLRDEQWLFIASGIELTSFQLGDLKSGKVTKRWSEANWLSNFGQGSRNGKYLAVAGCLSFRFYRLGLVAADGKSFQWTITAASGSGHALLGATCLGNFVPSEDGKFIAVAGATEGAAMVDVVNKRVLWVASWKCLPEVRDAAERQETRWKNVPLREWGSINAVAFAPEGKLLYVGGSSGTVSALKTDTGEVVSQWESPPPRRDEHPHSISSLSVSLDGRFVAAGTMPNGLVFLYSTKDGQRRVLGHGGSVGVYASSFSLDSSRLATCAHATIRIWKMPEEEGRPQRQKP